MTRTRLTSISMTGVFLVLVALFGLGMGSVSDKANTFTQPSISTQCPIFPTDNIWNREISGIAVVSVSQTYIDSLKDNNAYPLLQPDFGAPYPGVQYNGFP